MLFSHRIVLVTGASRGIGQAIALEFAKQGAIVAGTATTQAGVAAFDQLLQTNAVSGKGFLLDITDPHSLNSMWAQLKRDLGGEPHILINNAGITRDALVVRMSEDDWDQVLDTDLKSVYRVTKLCLKGMLKARFGRIITISSVVASSGNLGQANYAAAKAGIIGFSKSLALEVAARGITVNVVAPGFIETDMTMNLSTQQKLLLKQRIPCQSFGQVYDVAHACIFLASAIYITGHTLHINGGFYMV